MASNTPIYLPLSYEHIMASWPPPSHQKMQLQAGGHNSIISVWDGLLIKHLLSDIG